jgi:Mrp family chromosome partitioning ATPase
LALSLGASQASVGSRVLIVDADLRNPSLTKFFGGEGAKGLADAAANRATAREIIRRDEVLNVSYLTVGTASTYRVDIERRLKHVLAPLTKDFDLILIDSPPVGPVAGAIVLAEQVDTILCVVKWGTTPKAAVGQCIERLSRSGKPVHLALNMIDERRMPRFGQYAFFGGGRYGYPPH